MPRPGRAFACRSTHIHGNVRRRRPGSSAGRAVVESGGPAMARVRLASAGTCVGVGAPRPVAIPTVRWRPPTTARRWRCRGGTRPAGQLSIKAKAVESVKFQGKYGHVSLQHQTPLNAFWPRSMIWSEPAGRYAGCEELRPTTKAEERRGRMFRFVAHSRTFPLRPTPPPPAGTAQDCHALQDPRLTAVTHEGVAPFACPDTDSKVDLAPRFAPYA